MKSPEQKRLDRAQLKLKAAAIAYCGAPEDQNRGVALRWAAIDYTRTLLELSACEWIPARLVAGQLGQLVKASKISAGSESGNPVPPPSRGGSNTGGPSAA